MTASLLPKFGDGHVWPSREQSLLLRAACCRDERARLAFAAWRNAINIEHEFDWQMMRLLPAVYANLHALGESDPLMARLKGIYRRSFVETSQIIKQAEAAVAALAGAGIPVLALKGTAMVMSYYDSRAQRPMSDVDLAIRPEHTLRAVNALRELGWRPSAAPTPDRFRWFHALQFVHADGGELDLHWHVMVETTAGGGDELLWSASEVVSFAEQEVRVLAPTDMLFHTVLHGVRWNDASPIRWIIDANQIVARRGAEIDWARIVRLSKQLRVTHRMHLGLAHLCSEFNVPVPADVLDALRSWPVSRRERFENFVILSGRADYPKNAAEYHLTLLSDFSRVAEPHRNIFVLAWQLPHYLCFRFGLRGRRELFGVLFGALFRRLRVTTHRVDAGHHLERA